MTQLLLAPEGFIPSPHRRAVLGELHARPLPLVPVPASVYHYAFLIDSSRAEAEERAFLALAERRGWPHSEGKKNRVYDFPGGVLRREQHQEFVSYTWIQTNPAINREQVLPMTDVLSEHGRLLVAVRVNVSSDKKLESLTAGRFSAESLAISSVQQGKAVILTDFITDNDGYIPFELIIREGAQTSVGAIVQHLLEIETYRSFALLALEPALSSAKRLDRVEAALGIIIGKLAEHTLVSSEQNLAENRTLLDELNHLTVMLENLTVKNNYRLSASAAYHQIVKERLKIFDEGSYENHIGIKPFLERRLDPAMATCHVVVVRQKNLSNKLAQVTSLLRTRIDVTIQEQNYNLLSTMSRRVRIQLRMQQTVEGLSVAAISYYAVGLLGYLVKGLDTLVPLPKDIAVGAAVPLVMFIVWRGTVAIRRHHLKDDS